jgi:geranylgeranyl pyrophosphate synthase
LSYAEQTLRHMQARVEQALDHRLPASTESPERLHAAMRYATLNGGKRIRACLVYASGMAVGAAEPTLDAPACAVELIHAYSLVHDDLPCMDDDDLRRGKPTCHRAYDEATALLVGDALQSLAFEILATDTGLGVSAGQRLHMLAVLAQASGSRGMAGGQAIDLAVVGQALTEPALEDMHRRKTGALIRAAVMLGALAQESATTQTLSALDVYARDVGLAFQITDDVLDVEGDAAALGKTPGADRAHNKPTYPAVLGLACAKKKKAALAANALAAVTPLGDKARTLVALAEYIIERNR